MAGLSWLHISDWHQKGKQFERAKVRDALVNDIKHRTEINQSLEKLDFIAFSGDVAYSGLIDEYNSAIEQFFDPILDSSSLTKDRLFIVPGNHDLERAALDVLPNDLLLRFSSSEEVNKWLTDDRKRQALLGPLGNYSQFIKSYIGELYGVEPAFGYKYQFEVSGKTVAAIGINSAWLCARSKNDKGDFSDRGNLIVGEAQVYNAVKGTEEINIKIAIIHHPFDWFVEFDQTKVEESLGINCHFILMGHQHRPKVNVMKGPFGDCVVIPAGASYDRDIASNPDYVNSYNFVHLDFDISEGIVYFRKWNTRRGIWEADTSITPSGNYKFILPKQIGMETPLIKQINLTNSNLLNLLYDWKLLHTEMQSMFDKFSPMITWLDIGISKKPSDDTLYQIETVWQPCVSASRIFDEVIFFNYINEENIIAALKNSFSRIPHISIKIADAKSIEDLRTIRRVVSELREDIMTTLTVADRRIVSLVDSLRNEANNK